MHLPPPIHGATMMGKFIQDSDLINETFQCDYLNLSTSKNLSDIGKGKFRKLFIFFKLYLKVLSALLKNKYDLCYLTINSKGAAFYKELVIVFILKIFGSKIVYHYHNKGVSEKQDRFLQNLLYRFQFRNSRVILLSQFLYSDVEKYLPRSRVYYCSNGIPALDISTQTSIISKKEENPIPVILFLSNMMVEKGVFNLLKSLKLLLDKGLQFNMFFVGDWININESDFNKFVVANGLQENVFYEGKKFGADKSAYLVRADIFIHPTLNDCFPLVILEAMQYCLPVISTLEGGIPGIVDEGKTGFLIPKTDLNLMADKIEILLNNMQLRKEMGNAGQRKFYENYTHEHFEKNFKTVIEKILND